MHHAVQRRSSVVRRRVAAGIVILGACARADIAVGVEALPLLPHQTLGQTFIATGMLRAIRVVLPTWQSSNAAATLSLWSSTDRVERLVSRRLSNIADNAEIRLALRRPAPPGSYLWELSEPGAEGHVGVYADPVTTPRAGWAVTIGTGVNPTLQFRFRTEETPLPAVLIARLGETTNVFDRIESARSLALCADADHLEALAPLLVDDERSHAARIVFEAIPDARANARLRTALPHATGPSRVGILHSLGRRRDADAVSWIAPLLDDADLAVASAAAWALGRIGTAEAAQALEDAWRRSAPSFDPARRHALADALVDAARALEHHDPALGRRLFECLAEATLATPAASAAWLGLCRLDADAAVRRLAHWVAAGPDTHRRLALWALQHDLPGSNVTAAAIAQLAALPNEAAAAWAAALARRADPTAWRPFFAALTNASPEIHRAVISALLDWPPNDSVAAYLIDRLTDTDASGADEAAGRLERLEWSVVDRMLAERLQSSGAVASANYLLRVAARRRSREATAAVWTAARSHPDPALRALCARALGEIADPTAANDLADLLAAAGNDESMLTALTHAWRTALNRWPDRDAALRTLRGRWAALAPAARIAVLRTASSDGGAEAADLAFFALEDPSGAVRAEAVRRLSEWPSPLVLPRLVELAGNISHTEARSLLLQGALRLAASTNIPPDQRSRYLVQLDPLLASPAERRAWLAAATVPDHALLERVRPMLNDPELRAEAARSALSMAEALLDPAGPPDAAAIDTLRSLADQTDLADVTQRARARLERYRKPAQ